jgi:integrase/recombinase XerD
MRAFVQRVPPATIVWLYFDPGTAQHAASADALERYLRTMRDDLVHLVTLHSSPVLARPPEGVDPAARNSLPSRCGWSSRSRLAAAAPIAGHAAGMWFRPLIARRLAEEGTTTRHWVRWSTSATAATAAGRVARSSRRHAGRDDRR